VGKYCTFSDVLTSHVLTFMLIVDNSPSSSGLLPLFNPKVVVCMITTLDVDPSHHRSPNAACTASHRQPQTTSNRVNLTTLVFFTTTTTC
jgi:hypothetical protein